MTKIMACIGCRKPFGRGGIETVVDRKTGRKVRRRVKGLVMRKVIGPEGGKWYACPECIADKRAIAGIRRELHEQGWRVDHEGRLVRPVRPHTPGAYGSPVVP